MFAAVDVGNTATKIALIGSGGEPDIQRFPSREPSYNPIRELIHTAGPEKALICTVNPSFSNTLEKIFTEAGIPVLYADYRNIPLINRYSPPSEVGSDRLVTSFGVLKKFHKDAVVVDMGTALTCEVVTGCGEYLGGLIFPGIELLRRSLSEHTALLPLVELTGTSFPAVGKNTQEAVAGGIFRGVCGLVRSLVSDIQASYQDPLTVCVTGNDSETFRHCFPSEWNIVPDITMYGLLMLERELTFE